MNLSSFMVLPELVEEETVPFTAEEVERIWKDYEEYPISAAALVMIYTGMMPGELSSIKADMIDWEHKIIRYGIKTDRRKSAYLLIPDCIVPLLRDLLERGKNNGLLPYKMDTYRKAFKDMLYRIGADARCTPYSCRHTFATMLSTQVPAHVLARLMRNDIRVTQKYYLHEQDEVLLNEVNRALGQT